MDKKTNLVWIDIEGTGLMDGLRHHHDVKILEISLIITDKDLNIINDGIDLIINHPSSDLENLSDWMKENEAELINEVSTSTTTLTQAGDILLEEIKKYCDPKMCYLCGNSLWYDKTLINRYFPSIIEYLHYRIVDVSTVKILRQYWYPQLSDFNKRKTHRALDDVRESIAELKYYRENIFQK